MNYFLIWLGLGLISACAARFIVEPHKMRFTTWLRFLITGPTYILAMLFISLFAFIESIEDWRL